MSKFDYRYSWSQGYAQFLMSWIWISKFGATGCTQNWWDLMECKSWLLCVQYDDEEIARESKCRPSAVSGLNAILDDVYGWRDPEGWIFRIESECDLQFDDNCLKFTLEPGVRALVQIEVQIIQVSSSSISSSSSRSSSSSSSTWSSN